MIKIAIQVEEQAYKYHSISARLLDIGTRMLPFHLLYGVNVFYCLCTYMYSPYHRTEIEDLTRVVISYEMTTSVRFWLSYDCFKWDFIALKFEIILIENKWLSRTAS